MIVLLDMDGTVVDLHGPWLRAAHACCPRAAGDARSTTDILATYAIHDSVACGQHVYDHLTGDLYRSLPPMPGAIEAIAKLEADGHDVLFVTASARNSDTAAAKIDWAERHLGWSRHRVIIAQRKELIAGDVFVDDAPANLTAWAGRKREWTGVMRGLPLTIGYPYNAELPPEWRCGSFEDPAAAWTEIVSRIKTWAAA